MNRYMVTKSVALTAVALLIAGCGGGGGGGGNNDTDNNSASEEIDSTNAADVSRSVYDTSSGLALDSATQAGSSVTQGVEVSGDTVDSLAGVTYRAIMRVVDELPVSDADVVSGVTATGWTECDFLGDGTGSGRFKIEFNNEMGDSSTLEVGDAFTTTYDLCQMSGSATTIDGQMTFEVVAFNPDGAGEIGNPSTTWNFGISLTYAGFTMTGGGEDLYFDGQTSFDWDHDPSRTYPLVSTMTGGPITIESGDDRSTLHAGLLIQLTGPYSSDGDLPDEYELELDYETDLDTPAFHGTVTVQTNPLLTDASGDGDNWPDAGQFTIEDEQSTILIIDASECDGDGFLLTYNSGATTSDCEFWHP